MKTAAVHWLPFFWFASTALSSPTSHTSEPPKVKITNGTLLGTHSSHFEQDFFLGIPFAQPPVGQLRFNLPQSLNESWVVEKPATEYGPFCRSVSLNLQGFTQKGLTYPQSEDCLTLNIVRPAGLAPHSRLPVLVWIYGGGYQEGGSGDPRYNTSFLVKESVEMGLPIMAVTLNYRVSGYGFLGGKAVNDSAVANLGLHDQRLALRWIQDNIGPFGGDPARVTIAGESSGAISVGHHILAFGGRDEGLFHAAIAESGGPLSPTVPTSLERQEMMYAQVLNATNCLNSTDSLNCLRSAPVDALDRAFAPMTFNPVIDGTLVPGLHSNSLKEGKFVRVPLLIGANTNEGTTFLLQAGLQWVDSRSDLVTVVKAFDAAGGYSNSSAQELGSYYSSIPLDVLREQLGTVSIKPRPADGSMYGQASLYVGDSLFHSGRRFACEIWHKNDLPAYSYRFDVVPNGISPDSLGATHFQEVSYVFKNLAGTGYAVNPMSSNSTLENDRTHRLSTLMSRMWLSFAVTHSPNHHKVPNSTVWPMYKTHDAKNMVFHLGGVHTEQDSFRAKGISQIIDSFASLTL